MSNILQNRRIFTSGSTTGVSFTVVANYSALPPANTQAGKFYWCEASQGTWWLPGNLGGTYYPKGLYYSNGTIWESIETPYQATQAEVDAATATDVFVSPATLKNAAQWLTKFDVPTGTASDYLDGTGAPQPFPSIITQVESLVTLVYNKTGSNLLKGTVVYIKGEHGNLPEINLAKADADITSNRTYGLLAENINDNSSGYVIRTGLLENMDTQAYSAGDLLYLSPTNAGEFTAVKPSAPDHLVYVGTVIRKHPTQGSIEVTIQNGYELDEIHDVLITTPQDGDVLMYQSSTQLWKNQYAQEIELSLISSFRFLTGN